MDENFISILSEIKEDVDFENETALIDDGILDSFDILQIISALNEEYDISIPASEIVPDNFNSAKSLWAMVERLQDED
ncbi:Phosphopantetheine attachment site [Butyrivibrio fibrisolvens DSM 3071]|uniref:Phosphopantetheine attachment site n=1 Tax=Butyrivibrio fibrisolvens DSM 3071 TaxID=1121131 RepID=A0A1M6FAD4_BUTFI|nr:phosphopantetheine-binding protein [Butyrivibrio fibrisolvens]SHI94627.1 Phosphopantetheine attachment site [Butyrivibrio fibrisolvens DSM 3071]